MKLLDLTAFHRVPLKMLLAAQPLEIPVKSDNSSVSSNFFLPFTPRIPQEVDLRVSPGYLSDEGAGHSP